VSIINKRHIMTLMFSAAAAASAAAAGGGEQSQALLDRARALHKQVPLIDGHNDFPWEVREKSGGDVDARDMRTPVDGHTDLARLRAGGVGAQFWSVYVPHTEPEPVTATLAQIDIVHRMMRKYPETFELALTAADIERIFKAGRIASLIGMEGGHSIDSSLGALRMMYRLGARYMTITHNGNTPWADAASDKPEHGGLTAFGETVIREMNWLGMMVDLSHVSPETMADAIRVSEAPVIFSHSSARGVTNVPRNVPDDILRELPKKDGVVMVTFVPGFVSQEIADYNARASAQTARLREYPGATDASVEADMEAWRAANPSPVATLAQVADHIDHIRTIAGIDHVGIGGDFDGITTVPKGLEDVSTYPALTAELLRRGYSDDDVKKILGLNTLRVMRKVEDTAARLQKQRGPSSGRIK
jgi:membrane dipeptidase